MILCLHVNSHNILGAFNVQRFKSKIADIDIHQQFRLQFAEIDRELTKMHVHFRQHCCLQE